MKLIVTRYTDPISGDAIVDEPHWLDTTPTMRRDEGCGVDYVPWIGPDGQVGYRCEHDDGRVEFIYLNPSESIDSPPDERTPCVFLYVGPSGVPWADAAHHHYTIFDEEGIDAPDADR